MLHELDALEARRIADLANDARRARDRFLEKVRQSAFGEPKPARGEHDPIRDISLDDVLAHKPEVVALREAITALPREIRQSIWAVMEVGRGGSAAQDWELAMERAVSLDDADAVAALLDEPDLHICLGKGLYLLGMVPRNNAV